MQHSPDHMTAALPDSIKLKAASLKVESVTVAYGAHVVLDDISIDVAPGEFFALLGPSGCGKTTLLRLIAGFSETHSGQVIVDGVDISRLPPWKRDVGLVFQSYALWPHMTVASNVAFGLEERRLPKAEVKRRVATALDFVGLAPFGDRLPSQLSGGQQQRVALARTIAIEPKMLLLDEPLSNLDAKLRVQVRRELRMLQKRLGLTSIIVTHDQEEANTICDRVAVMNNGKIQQVGTPTQLYENPGNIFVAQFLGAANVIAGQASTIGDTPAFDIGDGVRIATPGRMNSNDDAKLVFRPQHAAIHPADARVEQSIAGKITEREFLGSSVRYNVHVGSRDIWIDAPFESEQRLHQVGAPVRISVAPDRMLWLST